MSNLHDLLLPYIYGTLNEAETARLEAALNEDAELRAALERAREGAAVMAEAAKQPGGKAVRLPDPAAKPAASTAPAGTLRSLDAARRSRRIVWSAVAAVLLVAIGMWAWFLAERQALRNNSIAVEVQAPSLFYRGVPADFVVKTTDGSGNPVSADVRLKVKTFKGDAVLFDQTVRSAGDGTVTVSVPMDGVPTDGEGNGLAEVQVAVTHGDAALFQVEPFIVEENLMDLTLAAPQTYSYDRPMPIGVHAASMKGAGIRTDVNVQVADPVSGDIKEYVVHTDENGNGAMALDMTPYGSAVRILAWTGDGLRLRQAGFLTVTPAQPLLAYVSTSKPMFRPGETVRMRAVVLGRGDLQPAGARLVKLLVTDPAGATVFETDVPVRLQNGCAWAEWEIPPGSTGGDYRVIVRDAQPVQVAEGQAEPAFADAARVIQIRNFRNPAFITEMELDKDAYGPGDKGNADLSVRTRDGRVPANAMLQCRLNVDGVTVRDWSEKLPAGGNIRLPFELPARIERGSASLVVTINDGAQVDSAVETIHVTLERVDMQFFPEGGDLVAGFDNRVYFRARNTAGEPIDLEGHVIDDAGEVVGSLKVDALGMGRFGFTPLAGRHYKVQVTKPAGITVQPELPPVLAAGVVMQSADEVIGKNQPLRVALRSNFNGPHAVGVYLRGQLVGQTTVNVQSPVAHHVSIPISTDQGGVFRVTVMKPDNTPAAERLIARTPARGIRISAHTAKTAYSPGETVALTLATTDAESGEPVQTVLGISVLDESVINLAKDEDTAPMPFHFLVGLEVEELEKVKVYLDGSPKAATALDRLLGTQGWRRFAALDRDGFVARYGTDAATRIVPALGMADGNGGSPTDTLQTAQARLEGQPRDITVALSTATQMKRHLAGQLEAQTVRFGAIARWCTIAIAGLLALGSLVVFVRRMPVASVSVRGPALVFASCLAVVVAMGVMIAERHKTSGGAMASVPAPEPMNPPGATILTDDGRGGFFFNLDEARLAGKFREDALKHAIQELEEQGGGIGPDVVDGIGLGGGRGGRLEDLNKELGMLMRNRRQLQQAQEQLNEQPGREANAAGAAARMQPAGEPAGRPMVGRFAQDEAQAEDLLRAEFEKRGLLDDLRDRKAFAERVVFREYPRSYVHEHAGNGSGERSDFADMVFWDAMRVTDKDGKAEVSFQVSDALTTWRIAVEGHSFDGRLASGEGTFATRLPFSLTPKLPVELTDGDRIDLPVAIYNTTDGELGVNVQLTAGEGLTLQGDGTRSLTIGADGTARAFWSLVAHGNKPGHASIALQGTAGSLADRLTQQFAIVPRGYPVQLSYSGVLKGNPDAPGEQTIEIVLPDNVDPESLRAGLKLFPSPVATLLAGLDGMLRQPGGCFEQTSSSNYPNVMILQYLDLNGIADPALRARAKGYLETGYQRLTSYECKTGGFEWFGQDPGHTALTGYGVLEFLDMSRVYTVDDGIVPRSVRWLMANRDEDGYFTQNRRALHTWVGGDQKKLNTAYICWAISEARDAMGEEIDWGKTLETLLKDARASEDPYFSALVARTLFNLGRTDESAEIAKMLAAMQEADGHLAGQTMSITCSRGVNLEIETTALSVLAFLQHRAYLAQASQGIQWLLGQRRGAGSFGATQGTILALKALVEYANASRTTVNACTISLANGDDASAAPLATRQVVAGEKGIILLSDFASRLKPGINRLRLMVSGEAELPWTIGVDYETSAPPSDPACAVKIETGLNRTQAQEGESVDVTVKVTNTTSQGVPMTTAIVGLPGGVEPRVDQLRDLKKAGKFDYFEIRNREVILYWTGLDPDAVKEVHFEALASIPGEFTAPASCVYLYYEDDKKHWIEPLKIGISRASND